MSCTPDFPADDIEVSDDDEPSSSVAVSSTYVSSHDTEELCRPSEPVVAGIADSALNLDTKLPPTRKRKLTAVKIDESPPSCVGLDAEAAADADSRIQFSQFVDDESHLPFSPSSDNARTRTEDENAVDFGTRLLPTKNRKIATKIDKSPPSCADLDMESVPARKRKLAAAKVDKPKCSNLLYTRNRVHNKFVKNRIVDSSDSDNEPDSLVSSSKDTAHTKNKAPSVRQKWTEDEMNALRIAFADFINGDRLPLWEDIYEAQQQFPQLAKRSKEKIKARFVHFKETNR
jgi:hypothetical protein